MTPHSQLNQSPLTDIKTALLQLPVLYTYTERGDFFFSPAIFSCSVNGLHNRLDLLQSFLPTPQPSLFLIVLKLLLHAFVLKTWVLITLNITLDRRRVGSITFCHGSFIYSSPFLHSSRSMLAQSKAMFLEVTQHFQVHRAGHMG